MLLLCHFKDKKQLFKKLMEKNVKKKIKRMIRIKQMHIELMRYLLNKGFKRYTKTCSVNRTCTKGISRSKSLTWFAHVDLALALHQRVKSQRRTAGVTSRYGGNFMREACSTSSWR